MTVLPYETLQWIQNGEPISGGVDGNSQGVLNRPLVQIHANIDTLRTAHDILRSEIETARGSEASLIDSRLSILKSKISKIKLA